MFFIDIYLFLYCNFKNFDENTQNYQLINNSRKLNKMASYLLLTFNSILNFISLTYTVDN